MKDEREYFSLEQYSMKLKPQFGKHLGLFRIHYFLSTAVNLGILSGKPIAAMALCCQLLNSIHQVALNNGGWDVAMHFIPVPDPIGPARFAGSLGELNAVASYKEALTTLKAVGNPTGRSQSQPATSRGDEDDAEEAPQASGQARRRAKAKGKAATDH